MPLPNPSPPLVLSFAPLDPSGATGILADAQSIQSMGCQPLAIATGFAVGDSSGWQDWQAQDDEILISQARAILEDMPVAAFRIGLPGSVENVVAMAEIVGDYPDIPLVLDPRPLGDSQQDGEVEIAEALIELLIPQASLLVVSYQAAEQLLDVVREANAAAREAGNVPDDVDVVDLDDSPNSLLSNLLTLGAEHVLLTGTHVNAPQIINTLFGQQGVLRTDSWERIPGHFRGASSTLSAATAAALACGLEMSSAVREAQEYTWQALAAAYRPGMGRLFPDRLFWARMPSDESGDDTPSPTLQ